MEKYTYLLINLGSILVPFIFSFEKRLGFSRYWKVLMPALAITAAFFIIWDHYLTAWGVWSFNPKYVVGIYIWGLPLEEWLFFITIPYSCVFTYSSLNVLLKSDPFKIHARNIFGVWFVVLAVIALLNTDKLYTGIKLSLTAFMVVFVWYRGYDWLGKFIRAYLVSLIPFLIVNGLLTWLPVVIYNDAENLGIRIVSIPIEDTQYTLLLLLMNIVLFEYFKKRYLPGQPVQSERTRT
ncbi:MAG: lycopene cyclase domain-containing protein [Bacteroidota bacterium]